MKNQKRQKQKVVIWGVSTQNPQEGEGRGVSPGARMDAGKTDGTRRNPHHVIMPNRVLPLEQEYQFQEVVGGGCLGGGHGNEEDMEDTVADGRERLKRHRTEVAGRVWIPEIWGQEEFLKDWVHCAVFDSPLVPAKIMSARDALVEEGRRAAAPALRVGNRC